MNDREGRKRVLWLAAIAGVLVCAIIFISLAAPDTSGANPDALRITPGGEALEGTDTEAAEETDAPGFSLSAGGAVSLLWRLALVVLVIAGAVVGLRWWGRKAMAPRSSSGFLRIVDTLAISNGRTIHLVALGERVIVVGATSQQLAYLNELTPDESGDVLSRIAREDQAGSLGGFAAELFQSLRKENPRGSTTAAQVIGEQR
jgi:flagellar biogenesis protein FliO